jgi:hypothetical protein
MVSKDAWPLDGAELDSAASLLEAAGVAAAPDAGAWLGVELWHADNASNAPISSAVDRFSTSGLLLRTAWGRRL